MSHPTTIKSGFKTPPLVDLKGRGPPTAGKKSLFSTGICRRPPLYPIVYTEPQMPVKGLKKGLYAAEAYIYRYYKFLSPVLGCS